MEDVNIIIPNATYYKKNNKIFFSYVSPSIVVTPTGKRYDSYMVHYDYHADLRKNTVPMLKKLTNTLGIINYSRFTKMTILKAIEFKVRNKQEYHYYINKNNKIIKYKFKKNH